VCVCVCVCRHACRVREKKGGDAYRYLTGEAEVGGRAALLARRGAGAVGAAGRVLPFPPLRGRLSGGLSFGATSKEKKRQRQGNKAYRRRQGVCLCVCVCVCMCVCVCVCEVFRLHRRALYVG